MVHGHNTYKTRMLTRHPEKIICLRVKLLHVSIPIKIFVLKVSLITHRRNFANKLHFKKTLTAVPSCHSRTFLIHDLLPGL